MKRPIRLSRDLALPLEVVTESVGILAVKRAGKSHTAKLFVEQLHRAAQQTVIVDPKGDWWGIRSSADGKAPGLPIVIVGGEHGDVPLEVGGGEIVARMVAVERVSVLIDLSELRKHQVATFMTAFLETLYRLKAKEEYRTPVMLVIDEADAIAPQRPQKGEERMLGAAEDIVRRGGQRGIGVTLVTQRAAVLNKNVLTQCGLLILLRTTGKQDIEAVNDWIKHHQQEERRTDVMRTIAAMPRGTAWVWAPGWPDVDGIFRQVEILPIETFDSGATPKPGERRVAPKTVADVDLEAVRRQMAATIEKAKADDPRELRRRIAALEAELRNKPAAVASAATEKRVEVPVLKESQLTRLEKAHAQFDDAANRIGQLFEKVKALEEGARAVAREIAGALRTRVEAPPVGARTALIRPQQAPTPPERVLAPPSAVMASRRGEDSPDVGRGGLRRILTALAQRPQGLTLRQIGVRAGLSSRSGTFSTYMSRGRQAGWIFDGGPGGVSRITGVGVAALGDYEPLPTGAALLEHWLRELGESGAARILRAVAGAYPEALTLEQVGTRAELNPRSGTFSTYLSRLRTLELIEGRGQVRASEELVS